MQSWAGFYGGNVQAPSLPPSVFGYAQNGAPGGDPFALMNDPQAVINFATKGSAVPAAFGQPACICLTQATPTIAVRKLAQFA
jgi:hypothetical protein